MSDESFFQEMQHASRWSVIWVGDRTLPWFDPNWPLPNGTRIFRIGCGEDDWIDLDNLQPVAGFTGSKVQGHQGNESNVQQILGVYNTNEWVVLNNSATHEQMIPNFYCETHAPDLGTEVYVPVDLRRLGKEGLMIDQEVQYIDGDGLTKTMHFKGDKTLRRVVELLINWKWVESAGWPDLLSRFPQLAAMTDYLISRKILFPDGTHPSHKRSIRRSNYEVEICFPDAALKGQSNLDDRTFALDVPAIEPTRQSNSRTSPHVDPAAQNEQIPDNKIGKSSEMRPLKGISVADLFRAQGMTMDEEETKQAIRQFQGRAKCYRKATPFGKIGNEHLYSRADILKDFASYSKLTKDAKARLYKALKKYEREPKARTNRADLRGS